MAYIALKPCGFAGQKFKIGEPIPDELIHPGSAKNLVRQSVIAPANGHIPASAVSITVHAEEGDMALELTNEGLQQVFDVFTSNVEGAESIIAQMTEEDALILLHASDARKSIKVAAEARAKALSADDEDGAGEEPTNPEGEDDPANPEDGAGEE